MNTDPGHCPPKTWYFLPSVSLCKLFAKWQILDSFKVKEFADDFSIGEHGRKFPKWVENTVEKEEIVLYEQFLLFPQCFQKTHKNQGLFGKE